MPVPPNSPTPRPSHNDWGAAARFRFDDPSKWVTVPSVPLLDEHELTNDAGRPIATVDRAALQEIADNLNHRVRTTGDPSTLILGHTSDDPRAPEKPAKGFVVNAHVKPFKRGEDGRVIYALHGDYKIRPKNAHLIEEYPRRSVELWWSRRDVDPIAMLGGSAPERDLGAVIRNGRLNHVCLDHTPRTGNRDVTRSDDTDVIKFHRRGTHTIENYAIPDATRYRFGKGGKVEKVMSEFKHGDLHSGSKTGPKVTSRDQAVAIALNEAGKSRKSMNNNGKPRKPARYEDECGDKMRYDDDLPLDTHDPGAEGIPTDDGDDWHGTPSADVNDGGGDDQDTGMSPAVQELLQSKQFRDLTSKIDQLFTMLTGGGGGGEPGAGPPGGVGGDDSMPEMPPPGTDASGMDPMGAGAPGGAPPPGGGGPPPPTEEDSRRGMGQRPVQMSADSTAFPGQSNTQIPDFSGRKVPSRMSRSTQMNGQRQAPGRTTDPRTAALEREVSDLRKYQRESKLRYSQSEAARRVEALVSEGYLFGHTPTLHAEGVEETKRHFAGLLYNAPSEQEGEQDVAYEENIIRTRYSRRRADPVRASQTGLSRFSRDPNQATAPGQAPAANDPENFEPVTDEETCEYAELVGARKMSRREAGQIMLQRRERR